MRALFGVVSSDPLTYLIDIHVIASLNDFFLNFIFFNDSNVFKKQLLIWSHFDNILDEVIGTDIGVQERDVFFSYLCSASLSRTHLATIICSTLLHREWSADK